MVRLRSASARCVSVGRAASRARSAAPTLTCEEPEPTSPRKPRSTSRSSTYPAPDVGARGSRGRGRAARVSSGSSTAVVSVIASAGSASAAFAAVVDGGRSRRRRSSGSPMNRTYRSEHFDGGGQTLPPERNRRGGQCAGGQFADPAGRGERAQRRPAQVRRAQLQGGAGEIGRIVGYRTARATRAAGEPPPAGVSRQERVRDVQHHVHV